MGWRIVKQPNGMFARFSDVVDDFTHMNLTRSEAAQVCQQKGCGEAEAEEKVKRGEADDAGGWIEDDGKPLLRWRDALETIRAIHSEEHAEATEWRGSEIPAEEAP